MTKMIQSIRTRTGKLILAGAVVAGAVCLPSFASAAPREARNDRGPAGRFDGPGRNDRNDRFNRPQPDRFPGRFDRRDDRRDDRHDDRRDGPDVRIGINIGGASPVYRTQTERVWIDPVYRTVCDRVWVEPVYREDCTRVWIEPVYEIRETVSYEYGRRVVRREQVLVCAGHWEDRRQQVLIREGHWTEVQRQELVCAGRWEYRTTQVCVDQQPSWNLSFGFGR